jgi:hypothetical protein
MPGNGGDDFICDTVDLSCWGISILLLSREIPFINAASAKTTMTYHSPRVMVATGLPLIEIEIS